MAKRIGAITIGAVAVSCFGLWAAGAAACQSASSALVSPSLISSSLVSSSLVSSSLPSSSISSSLASESLPDSPSTEAAALKKFEETRLAGGMRPNQFEFLDASVRQRDSKTIFDKYLSRRAGPAMTAVDPNASGSLMGRATHAAVGVFVTRDESGNGRINTSYFLRALTAVAADTASRPYWRRSPGEPLADFGSTVGNDAGMNLLHEFGPGLQQMMKSHAPRFVTRMVEKVARN